MTAYEQVNLSPEAVDALLEGWSDPVQVRAHRESNGALDLIFRNYTLPVMGAPVEDPKPERKRPRATDQ